ncbi:hypothetical protein KEM56_002186 [Ascosphaera pollenicola]|nr:hypothetical protein KEM56_002186 [Ascosphaera pollenicola]
MQYVQGQDDEGLNAYGRFTGPQPIPGMFHTSNQPDNFLDMPLILNSNDYASWQSLRQLQTSGRPLPPSYHQNLIETNMSYAMPSIVYVAPYIEPELYATQAIPPQTLQYVVQNGSKPTISSQDRQTLDDTLCAVRGQCKHKLREVFNAIAWGRLMSAHRCLIDVTEWLMVNYNEADQSPNPNIMTGLAVDIDTTKEQGFKVLDHKDKQIIGDGSSFWRLFNHCWLALLTRQIEYIQCRGKDGFEPLELLTCEAAYALSAKAVELADALQDSGLVDYQNGFWEDAISTGMRTPNVMSIGLPHQLGLTNSGDSA